MSTPSTNPYQVAPLRGGQIKGGQPNQDTSFTGGIPVLDSNKVFTSTTTSSNGPPSYMAIRTSNVSNMIKIESGAKQAPTAIFTSATDASYGLMTYIGLVHRHFIEYGMDALFYFTTHDGTLVNILQGHSQFTKDDVSKQSTELYKNRNDTLLTLPLERYDMYDLQNLRFSAAFILNSISPALRAQVLTKSGNDYNNGPIVWMYVMGLVQSSSYRGTKILQKTFEERKIKNEPGENVIKHTIKLRDDYMRLYNANMVPYDALMTIVDSLIDSSTPTFAVWAATKRIAVSKFLKDNAGKTQLTLSLIVDAPTIESICNEADDEYQSLMESGLWVALDSKKDKDAAPTAYLLEKLSTKVDKLTANIEKREGTCWTCGKEGHKSPECPTKTNRSLKNSTMDQRQKHTSRPDIPAWQQTKPTNGESETMVRNNRSWSWCNKCTLWSTTHSTATHKGPTFDGTKKEPPNSQHKQDNNQGNLAETVNEDDNRSQLMMGAWCGFTTESTSTTPAPDSTLGTWITVVSRSSKNKNKNTAATCTTCKSLFYRPLPITNSTCHWCDLDTKTVQTPHDIGNTNNRGSHYTNPSTRKSTWVPTTPPTKSLVGRSNCPPAIISVATQPPIKTEHILAKHRHTLSSHDMTQMDLVTPRSIHASTLLSQSLRDNFFTFGPLIQDGFPALVSPMSDPAWSHSCQNIQINPGVHYSNDTNEDDFFKVIWDTGASEVITSDPADFVGGYTKPSSPLRLRGVSSGTMVEGIGVVEYCFRTDDHTILTVRMKAYYMPGSLPTNIKLLPPQRLCRISGGDFVTTGTTAILRLPDKPTLTMELDHNSHLPCCLGTRSASVLAQGHQINLCVTAASNQNLSTSQKVLLHWHFRFGHLNFTTIQWILRSGIFGKSPFFSSAGKCEHPECATCEYGKARRRPTKSTKRQHVPERENALKGNTQFPGQQVSLDHFVCSTKGRLPSSKGKTPTDQMYCGGAIFVDQASGYIFIQSQVAFSSEETLQAKKIDI